jgi:hypothetical protein
LAVPRDSQTAFNQRDTACAARDLDGLGFLLLSHTHSTAECDDATLRLNLDRVGLYRVIRNQFGLDGRRDARIRSSARRHHQERAD